MNKIKDQTEGRYSFYCPGCEHDHIYYVNSPHWYKDTEGWHFNGDLENPTFTPSLLNTWNEGRCHLYVTNGVINYCNDCTHEYNGKQNVPMKQYS